MEIFNASIFKQRQGHTQHNGDRVQLPPKPFKIRYEKGQITETFVTREEILLHTRQENFGSVYSHRQQVSDSPKRFIDEKDNLSKVCKTF